MCVCFCVSMCVCVTMPVCLSACLCSCMCVHVSVCMWESIRTCIYEHVCVHVRVYMLMRKCTCVFKHAYVHDRVYAFACKWMSPFNAADCPDLIKLSLSRPHSAQTLSLSPPLIASLRHPKFALILSLSLSFVFLPPPRSLFFASLPSFCFWCYCSFFLSFS